MSFSFTLFKYILKDLLKIFLMTLGVMAGIMSFGGLLKPLMQYGLSGAQVMQMLTYFMPAAQTYALPIAALFATTMVYGRLSADNELTACRAAGFSYAALIMPAFLLGLVLALAALVSLSFVVPHYTLKVEKVAFSSLAEMVQKNIQRQHHIKISPYTIYADHAEVLAASTDHPGDEVVVLHNPMFFFYEPDPVTKIPVPTDFYTARTATVLIRQTDDRIEFSAKLDGGATFSRDLHGAAVGGVERAEFGPIPIDSPIKENTKFMTIRQLKALSDDPLKSRKIRALHATITREKQEAAFLLAAADALNARREVTFGSEAGESFTVLLEKGTQYHKAKTEWVAGRDTEIRVQTRRNGEVVATDAAKEVAIRAQADPAAKQMKVELQLKDVLVDDVRRPNINRTTRVPMSPAVLQIAELPPRHYLETDKGSKEIQELKRRLPGLRNGIVAEIHGRVSFAISCLILVLMGSSMGLLFRTGNFLSAFALSVIPALLCIALIATGQHVAENNARNLGMGLGVIWSGNVLVMGIFLTLLGVLRRQ
jgi:lipopolysaccharide export LptBFGC system permease protein LptF